MAPISVRVKTILTHIATSPCLLCSKIIIHSLHHHYYYNHCCCCKNVAKFKMYNILSKMGSRLNYLVRDYLPSFSQCNKTSSRNASRA